MPRNIKQHSDNTLCTYSLWHLTCVAAIFGHQTNCSCTKLHVTAVCYRDSRTHSIHRFSPISENQQKVTAGPTAITNRTSGGSLSRIQKLARLGITRALRTTPTSAVEALICLPPLELVVLSEVRSAVHRLWILGCWFYLHPSTGQSSTGWHTKFRYDISCATLYLDVASTFRSHI